MYFFSGKNHFSTLFYWFYNENPPFINILYINVSKEDSPSFLTGNGIVDYENTYKGKKVKGI